MYKRQVNARRTAQGLPEIAATDFLKKAKDAMALLDMDPAFLSRSVNTGFSGGEKKRNEVLQLSLLEPRLAILDEIDSGLDIDAMRVVATAVEALRSPDRSMIIICLLYTSPSPRDRTRSRMPSSA